MKKIILIILILMLSGCGNRTLICEEEVYCYKQEIIIEHTYPEIGAIPSTMKCVDGLCSGTFGNATTSKRQGECLATSTRMVCR